MDKDERQSQTTATEEKQDPPSLPPVGGATEGQGKKLDTNIPDLKPGMTVRIHQKIKEVNPKGEEKERIQIFEGIIIARHKKKASGATVTVRKVSHGVGVEKIFPIHLPTIIKWELVKQVKVRRAKLYYLRTHKKRLKEVKA